MNYDYQVITDHTSNYICMHIILDSDTLTHIDIDIHLKLITCTVICHYTGTWHVMYYVLVLCILYTMHTTDTLEFYRDKSLRTALEYFRKHFNFSMLPQTIYHSSSLLLIDSDAL